MSGVLVSPTEPALLKATGISSSIPESRGADILIASRHTTIGIQRKQFPGDFMSSMNDGRLNDLALKLSASVQVPILVLEGQPKWTRDGVLVDDRVRRFTLTQLNRWLLSLFAVYGVTHFWTRSVPETANLIVDFEVWASRAEHGTSLLHRPGIPGESRDIRGKVTDRNRAIYMLQALAEGVGPDVAARIFDHFERVPLRWDVTAKQMGGVDKVGPKRVQALSKMVPYTESEETE